MLRCGEAVAERSVVYMAICIEANFLVNSFLAFANNGFGSLLFFVYLALPAMTRGCLPLQRDRAGVLELTNIPVAEQQPYRQLRFAPYRSLTKLPQRNSGDADLLPGELSMWAFRTDRGENQMLLCKSHWESSSNVETRGFLPWVCICNVPGWSKRFWPSPEQNTFLTKLNSINCPHLIFI